jgi:uncharacterized protein YlzI (FlbEa/FlbD family)
LQRACQFGSRAAAKWELFVPGIRIELIRQKPDTVWTLLEGDEGQLVIESGLHVVNRIGYLVTERGIENGTSYAVRLAHE